MSSWSNNLSRRSLSNVPSPNPERSSYARFIPREELGPFETWAPGDFNGAPAPASAEPTPPPPPPPPTPEEWRARIDAARQAGYQDGYRDGLSALEGFKKSHADQVGQQLGRFVQGLDAEFDHLHEQLAAGVTRVAVQLARQVLRSELEIAPEHVAKVAAEAVEAVLLSARHITLHVHPQDLPLVTAGAQEVLQARGARVVGNPSIARGGCRVESEVGAIDAHIATRWAQAAAALGSDEPWQSESEEESS
jgi:flagellar assembly protein FliH